MSEYPLNAEYALTTPGDFRLIDLARQPHPTPCPDCGRTHLNGENISMTVPTLPTGTRVVWSGCADCWVIRTSPAQSAPTGDDR